jgi:DNA repair protein RadD
MQTLRDYQQAGRAEIFSRWREGARSILAVSPTGSGKTTLFGHIAYELSLAKRRALVIAHRRELVEQAGKRLMEFGVPFGVIMAGEPRTPYAAVQIASVQTLIRRKAPEADLVICDEAHLSTAQTWKNILEQYTRARILGVTATPWRRSGRPLAGTYDALVVVSTPRELREKGHLCNFVGFSYRAPDVTKIETSGGEYNDQASAAAMSLLVDTVVEEWLKHASELSTVVFNATVEHSLEVTAQFRAAGVVAEHLDGSTPLELRRGILRRVASGQTRVLCNVGVCIEGLDIPRLKCCVLNRPMRSLTWYLQMVGRVMRPWEGVTARIHDHGLNIARHGLPDADRDYALIAKPARPKSLRTCKECFANYEGPTCPFCGAEDSVFGGGGPGEIQTTKEAEQFTFAAGDASPAVKPTTEVKWNSPGRALEGRFVRAEVTQTEWGARKAYLIETPKKLYRFGGTSVLDSLLKPYQIPGLLMRVTYQGEEPLDGGRFRKRFKLEVDDGS